MKYKTEDFFKIMIEVTGKLANCRYNTYLK